MSIDVKRAWKDREYRASLTPEQLAALPANPAGDSWADLSQRELSGLVGGAAEEPADTVADVSCACSCGYICTATTECPILSFCCREVVA